MMKKVLILILGFGMITAGIAGITTSFVDRRNEAALKQLERAQEEARAVAAEDQRKIEEKRREIDRLAMSVQEERQRIEEAHRRADEARRLREAANQERKRASASASAPAISSKGPAKGKASETEKKRTVLSRKQQEPAKAKAKTKASESGAHGSMTAKASKQEPPDAAIKQISRKAGLEAARLFERVEYFNRKTGELILAEPFDAGPGSVRVRIRIWRHNRLVKDDLIRVSEDSSRRSPKHQA